MHSIEYKAERKRKYKARERSHGRFVHNATMPAPKTSAVAEIPIVVIMKLNAD